jgi:hypothetical protein
MADEKITKGVSWRIYRLPGSREVWHVDSGPGTHIINVRGFVSQVPCRSVDIGGDNVPRAWIEIPPYFGSLELYVIAGVLYVTSGIAVCVVPVSASPDAVPADAAAAQP